MGFRQHVHAVPVPPAVDDERQQHCIVDGRHVDIVARQNQRIVFNILPDLEDRRVVEQRRQNIESKLA